MGGSRLFELLKQIQYYPESFEIQLLQIYSATQNIPDENCTWIRKYSTENIVNYMTKLKQFLLQNKKQLLVNLQTNFDQKMTNNIREQINQALTDFSVIFK